MILSNILSVLSIAISIVSLFFLFYSIIKKPFKKASIPFAVFSFMAFIVTISEFFILSTNNYNFALGWTYLLIIGVLFLPISQLILLLDFVEFKSLELKEIYKYLLYLIPIAFIVILFLTRSIDTEKSIFGYVLSTTHMKFLTPIYSIVANILIASLLSFEMYRRKKLNISIKGLSVFLTGIIIYILTQIIYQTSLVADLVVRIPSNIVSVIFLYVFILMSIFIVRTSTHNISLTKAFDNIQDCLLITDHKGDILEFDKSMDRMLFGANKSASNKNFSSENIKSLISKLISSRQESNRFFKFLESNSPNEFKSEVTVNNKGNFLIYDVSISPILDRSNNILGRVSIFRDITKQKQYEKEVEYISFHDKLTGLYNRYYFEEELKRLNTKRQLPASIIMADADGLKYINDRFGHKKGDRLIIAASKIIKNSCREEDIIARWGGDEFIIFLPKTSGKDARDVIDRIRKAYKIQKLDDKTNISISLGLSTKNKLSENIEDIIEQADKNMYIDKAKLKNNIDIR